MTREIGGSPIYILTFQGIFLAVLYCFCNSEVQDTIKRLIKRITTRHDVRRSATINSSRYARDRYGNGNGGGMGGAAESVLSKQRKKSRCGSIATFDMPVSRGTPTAACAPGDRAQNGHERLSILNRQLTVDSTSPTTTTTVDSTSSSIGAEMKLMVRTSPVENPSLSTTTALISPSLANGATRNGRDYFRVNGENVKRTAV